MRTLALCDDPRHPAARIRAGLAPLAAQGVEIDWIENPAEWSPERMAAYPAVILSKSNNVGEADPAPWMTPAVEAGFERYVRDGGGLLAIHSGTAGYRETPVLRALPGGVFTHHPEQCTVTAEPVTSHPLAAGSAQFTHHDEHYFMDLDDTAADIVLTTRSEHGQQPGGWTRAHGAGRVCVLTPGHNLPVWLDPAYQGIIAAALHWCSGAP